jgi:hypothetical protein
MSDTSRNAGPLPRSAGLVTFLTLAVSTVLAAAASGQNHFSVVAGAVGLPNSAVKAEI